MLSQMSIPCTDIDYSQSFGGHQTRSNLYMLTKFILFLSRDSFRFPYIFFSFSLRLFLLFQDFSFKCLYSFTPNPCFFFIVRGTYTCMQHSLIQWTYKVCSEIKTITVGKIRQAFENTQDNKPGQILYVIKCSIPFHDNVR